MKKRSVPVLILITVIFISFTLGFFFGKNLSPPPVTLSIPVSMHTEPTVAAVVESTADPTEPPVIFPVDLNTAGVRELTALPGIGDVLAARILAYREEQKGFSSVNDLLNVDGIGKKRFEAILDLITIGG